MLNKNFAYKHCRKMKANRYNCLNFRGHNNDTGPTNRQLDSNLQPASQKPGSYSIDRKNGKRHWTRFPFYNIVPRNFIHFRSKIDLTQRVYWYFRKPPKTLPLFERGAWRLRSGSLLRQPQREQEEKEESRKRIVTLDAAGCGNRGVTRCVCLCSLQSESLLSRMF